MVVPRGVAVSYERGTPVAEEEEVRATARGATTSMYFLLLLIQTIS